MAAARKCSSVFVGACVMVGLMILTPPGPVLAIQAGINVDIHQDVPVGTPLPNGFLMSGRLKSGLPLGMPGGGGWAQPPVLLDHVDGYLPNVFPLFEYAIDPDYSDPNENEYTFWCLWSDPFSVGIPFRTTYHVGLLFDQNCHNVVIDVSGSWALDGIPIGIGMNGGWVPIPGFEIFEQEPPQTLHLRNGNANGVVEPGEIQTEIVQMDFVVIPSREELEMLLGPDPFRELWEGGAQAALPWEAMFYGPEPISDSNPYWFDVDSFFDVFFDGSSPVHPLDPIQIPLGGYVIVRERQLFWNNAGEMDYRWAWEFHEAHQADLGDAPDSTNSFGLAMTAYPPGGPPGVSANFPTVYVMGSPPHGPIHFLPRTAAWLGGWVSLEDEADIGFDEDGVNNLDVWADLPDLDMMDDGVTVPLALPHCQPTSFNFIVSTGPAPVDPMYVNVWFDWTRNGDWDDTSLCPYGLTAPEWAVQNMVLSGLTPYTGYVFTTPAFMPWHPSGAPQTEPIWMRITISEKPWDPIAGQPGHGGAGPPEGYSYGETEDYYFLPGEACEPTPDGQGCEPVVCPVPTEQCLPKKVNHDPATDTIVVTECECMNPDDCRIYWDAEPYCTGVCPPYTECITVGTMLPNGTVDYECLCEPLPPQTKWAQWPHPGGEGFDAASDLWWPQIFKAVQPPDPNWSGLHSHDWSDLGGQYFWVRIADDWLCEGGDVTDLHWWGNYEENDRHSGIDHFHLSIHVCGPGPGPWCVPSEPPLWEMDVPMPMILETDTGMVNNLGEIIYQYELDLPEPFPQVAGTYYWLDVQAVAVNPFDPPLWRWQEARRDVAPPLGHAPAAQRTESALWSSIIWSGGDPDRYSDMAFAVTSVVQPEREVNKVVADDFRSDGRRIEGLRWWGSYFDERYAPDGMTDPLHVLDGWLISFHHDAPDHVCPPDALLGDVPTVLGVYFAPPEAVTILGLDMGDCFGHGVYEYIVNLSQCCLICAESDPRLPNGRPPAHPEAFFETHGFIYWLDIQAVTGATWVPTAVEPGCDLRLTGHLPSDETPDGHFWGWHTSPDHWREEACTGRIVDFSPYPPNCWAYGDWVKQPWLCWLEPPFPPVDMAFELLTPEKRGDCTGDGVVDIADYLVFESCLAGPNAGLGYGCECADLDVDMDVDLADFAIFQTLFEG
ncbi:MAG: hypothetical protein JXB13_01325 [Phycisphaerae bacterium]|nr:hypothetical protein [Phycisphaerae bacterium]